MIKSLQGLCIAIKRVTPHQLNEFHFVSRDMTPLHNTHISNQRAPCKHSDAARQAPGGGRTSATHPPHIPPQAQLHKIICRFLLHVVRFKCIWLGAVVLSPDRLTDNSRDQHRQNFAPYCFVASRYVLPSYCLFSSETGRKRKRQQSFFFLSRQCSKQPLNWFESEKAN